MNYSKKHYDVKRSGFTLVELMVVIVIIGLLAGFVGNAVMSRVAKAKMVETRAQIKALHNAVNMYKLDTGQYPIDLEDLVERPADVSGWAPDGYLDGVSALPGDAWGNSFYYDYPGEYSKFDIYSLGADDAEGGDDEDADIYNSDVAGGATDAETEGL